MANEPAAANELIAILLGEHRPAGATDGRPLLINGRSRVTEKTRDAPRRNPGGGKC
jgi:hypothetical protein